MRDTSRGAADDVRMRGFVERHTVEAALNCLDSQLQPLAAVEVPLLIAAGRVLAASVISEVDVRLSWMTMDGYAVAAVTTEGATPYSAIPLIVIGDSMPGCAFNGGVSAGQAVRVMTGAPMPEGSDAVLPAEWVEAEPNQAVIRALADALARQTCRQNRRRHRPRNNVV